MSGWDEFRVVDESEAALVRDIQSGVAFSKPGRRAQYEYGVTYVGHWETYKDGVSIAVRRHAAALRDSGVPVFLQSESFTHANTGVTTAVEYHTLPPVVLAEVGDITEPRHGDSSVLVRHTVPSVGVLEATAYPRGMHFMSPESLAKARARTVLFAAFEEDHVPESKVRCMNLLGNVWVPSGACAKWLVSSGVEESKVLVVPHPFYGRDPVANAPAPWWASAVAEARGKARQVWRFLNVSKWEPRKGQHTLLGAFLTAFGPGDEVELVLKSEPFANVPGYPVDWVESVQQWLAHPAVAARGWSSESAARRVKVLWKRTMDRKQLAQLYSECDAYVSAGRSEGFDLPAFDAKLVGLRVVRADNGGPGQFCGDGDVVFGVGKRASFHPWYGFAGSTWCDYGEGDLARALREVYDSRHAYQPSQAFDRSPYTLKAVGALMRSACERLAPELVGVHT